MTATDAAQAERLLGALAADTEALLAVVEQETALLRAGRLAEALTLDPRKSQLAGRYLANAMRLRAGAALLARERPAALAALQQRHDEFRARLQINLAVLATAHAVAEGLIRGAAGEAARKSAPQTYGAAGRAPAPPRAAAPVVLSRNC